MSTPRRLTVRLYPTLEAKHIKGRSNESVSNNPYGRFSLRHAQQAIERFKQQKRNRKELLRQGMPADQIPPSVFFCNEHDTADKLGEVKDIYVNDKDKWLWANIKTYPHTADRVNKYIKNQRIRGVSLGYYLCPNDYKEIEEISLTSSPDFVNSKIKVVHSTQGNTLYQNIKTGPFPPTYYMENPTPVVTDDIPSLTPEDFDSFSPEEKQQFLKRGLELEAKEEAIRKQQEEEHAQADAEQHYDGVNLLLGVLQTEEDKKSAVGNRMMAEAVSNPLYAQTLKMADAAVKLEQEKAAELERQNKELMEKLTSLQKNAEFEAIQNARISGGFATPKPIKVGHSSSMSSSSVNLFTLVRSKRSASQITPSPAAVETAPPSFSSLPAPPIGIKVEHSSSSSSVPIPAGFDYVEPQSGFSLRGLFQPTPDYSKVPEDKRIKITHSSKKGVAPLTIAPIDADDNQISLELLRNVVEAKRDFGDAWHGAESLQNSLLFTNPRAMAQIIGGKNYLGVNITNADEGVFGYNDPRMSSRYCAPDDPSGNPFYRRDPGYVEKYHVPSADFGIKRVRIN